MGIFTGGNRVTGTVEPLAEATGYRGTIGAKIALIENIQNDRALFEAVIETDFKEVHMLREGAEIEALTEASISEMGTKIKEFLKRAWEKIKALISSFINMLMTVIIRDNKKLVDKYRTEVLKKTLTKMKFKWSECKKGKDLVFSPDFDRPANIKDAYETTQKLTRISETDPAKVAEATAKVRTKEFKNDWYKENGLDGDDLLKSYRETEFKDSDTIEGMSGNLLRNIMTELEGSKDTLKAFNTAKTDAEKVYTARLKEIDEDLKKAASASGAKDIDIKKINYKHAIVSVEQEIVTSLISTTIAVYKGRIKECRAAFSRAVAFNEKLVKENAELEDAMDDVQHGIIDDLFENEIFA